MSDKNTRNTQRKIKQKKNQQGTGNSNRGKSKDQVKPDSGHRVQSHSVNTDDAAAESSLTSSGKVPENNLCSSQKNVSGTEQSVSKEEHESFKERTVPSPSVSAEKKTPSVPSSSLNVDHVVRSVPSSSVNVEKEISENSLPCKNDLLKSLLNEKSMLIYRNLVNIRVQCSHCQKRNILLQGDLMEMGQCVLTLLEENEKLKLENKELKLSEEETLPGKQVQRTVEEESNVCHDIVNDTNLNSEQICTATDETDVNYNDGSGSSNQWDYSGSRDVSKTGEEVARESWYEGDTCEGVDKGTAVMMQSDHSFEKMSRDNSEHTSWRNQPKSQGFRPSNDKRGRDGRQGGDFKGTGASDRDRSNSRGRFQPYGNSAGGFDKDNRNRGRGFDRNCSSQWSDDRGQKTYRVVTETSGDLFTAPDEFSLAHCVAEDMRMGSGIAISFRNEFKYVDNLLSQCKKTGEVAVLQNKDRYIYYLVTKKVSTGKPTIADLRSSVTEMKKHCIENSVKKIAMPRIGCGLDRLYWSEVKDVLEDTFSDTDVSILVYNYQQEENQQDAAAQRSKLYVVQKFMRLVSIEPGTGLVFLGTEDGYIDETITSLDEKFHFIDEYKRSKKNIGDVVRFERKNDYLYGLIVKKTIKDPFSYIGLNKCLQKFKNMICKDDYHYFGMEAFIVDNDDLTVEKVITLLKNVFFYIKKEAWICWPPNLEEIFYCYNQQNMN